MLHPLELQQTGNWLKHEVLAWSVEHIVPLLLSGTALFVGHALAFMALNLGAAFLGAYFWGPWGSILAVATAWILAFLLMYVFQKHLIHHPIARLFLRSVRNKLGDPSLPTNPKILHQQLESDRRTMLFVLMKRFVPDDAN